MNKPYVKRFKEILKTLIYYGFGYMVDSKFNNKKKSPENLRKAFEKLGPTFIKIGQILSTRPDIFPKNYINELTKLQDNVTYESFKSVNNIFIDEFNKNIEDVFIEFNKNPIASASVAQVYAAKLPNNMDVMVKIQRPDIIEKMNIDLLILKKIISLKKIKIFDSIINGKEALDEVLDSTKLELDFNNEVKNIEKFKSLNNQNQYIYAPKIVKNLCSKKVITMEKINGFKITNLPLLKKYNYDRDTLSKHLILSLLKQIFEDGFFHGDPHPGNLLIYKNKICFIDFGIMGNLSKTLRNYLKESVIALAYKDTDKLVSILMCIGLQKGIIDKDELSEDIDYLFEIYFSTPLKNIKISSMFQEVFNCANKNNIQLPKDLTLLIRTLIILEGVVEKISPNIKMLDLAILYVKSNNEFDIFNNIDFKKIYIDCYRMIKDYKKIPNKKLKLINNVLKGKSKIQFCIKDSDNILNNLNQMINRIIGCLIICSLIIGSSLILNISVGPKIYNIPTISLIGYTVSFIIGFLLIISTIKSTKL